VNGVATPALAQPGGRSILRRIVSVTRRIPNVEFLIGAVIIGIWAILIAGAPLIAPYGPLAQQIRLRLQPPSAAHWFGTDQLGRDIFSRVLYGGRESFPAAIAVVMAAFVIGVSLGAIAGYRKGVIDDIVMRLTDMVLGFPLIVLAMAVAAALGASLGHGIIALAAVWWPSFVRVSRALVLDLSNKEYVMAARAAGRRPAGILFRVILPNALPALLVMAAIDIGRAILIFRSSGFSGSVRSHRNQNGARWSPPARR
jgi:peptide/nickel transport system permease protein